MHRLALEGLGVCTSGEAPSVLFVVPRPRTESRPPVRMEQSRSCCSRDKPIVVRMDLPSTGHRVVGRHSRVRIFADFERSAWGRRIAQDPDPLAHDVGVTIARAALAHAFRRSQDRSRFRRPDGVRPPRRYGELRVQHRSHAPEPHSVFVDRDVGVPRGRRLSRTHPHPRVVVRSSFAGGAGRGRERTRGCHGQHRSPPCARDRQFVLARSRCFGGARACHRHARSGHRRTRSFRGRRGGLTDDARMCRSPCPELGVLAASPSANDELAGRNRSSLSASTRT